MKYQDSYDLYIDLYGESTKGFNSLSDYINKDDVVDSIIQQD